MIGQYTDEEIQAKINRGTAVLASSYINGHVVIRTGSTNNYYRRNYDGSWTNYDCKTVYVR